MRPVRIAVIEILSGAAPVAHLHGWIERIYIQQLYSIMPQVVAGWCRQAGHDVHYVTYYGQTAPERLLPDDVELVFISAHTQAAALAICVSRLLRLRGVQTVLGGPHATAFGELELDHFDAVIGSCDEETVLDVVRGHRSDAVIERRSTGPVRLPSIADRWGDIVRAAGRGGRLTALSVVGLHASLGCPYTCDFCVDWSTPYALIPKEDFLDDLRTIARFAPGRFVAFHDPNFGVRFDDTMACIETVWDGLRVPFGVEASLSILNDHRLERMCAAGCELAILGIESWYEYGDKAKSRGQRGMAKFARVVDRIRAVQEKIPYVQANFILGLDSDVGPEPFEITRRFIHTLPGVWPAVAVPLPIRGTPWYAKLERGEAAQH